MKAVEDLLELSGIGRRRMALRWVSAAELDRVFKITDGVIRHLIVRKEA
mgnify:CR=1 FL=1